MITFDEMKAKIKATKTQVELDALRLPLVQFVPSGGSVADFEKLQKMFISQKRKVLKPWQVAMQEQAQGEGGGQ